jgi:hypothetical protein
MYLENWGARCRNIVEHILYVIGGYGEYALRLKDVEKYSSSPTFRVLLPLYLAAPRS